MLQAPGASLSFVPSNDVLHTYTGSVLVGALIRTAILVCYSVVVAIIAVIAEIHGRVFFIHCSKTHRVAFRPKGFSQNSHGAVVDIPLISSTCVLEFGAPMLSLKLHIQNSKF